ncbi:metallophosphoesterase family protein [Chelativorans sp. YIM 93263]|uniref:metallophosphoesterase family protein n=1 Tax=Chelativorans sp. YIM 93263 TaxID=2906648 RepID=UPI00237849C1|nr:metallophosphoesterase [Chelativorans sp. YIM 93263]
MTEAKVKVAAIADLHIKEDGSVSYRSLFNEIAREADVLVIAGDLTDLGKPQEAELLAEDLRGFGVPVVGVLGNHDYECDAVEEVSHILHDAGVHLLDGQTVELNGVGFAGVKGFAGGFGKRMLGSFGEPAIKTMVAETVSEAMKLENALRQLETERSLVVLHYAPIPATVEGEPPEVYPFLGSSRFGETIDRFNVSAVVHGHAHHGVHEGKTPGGVRVLNVAQDVEKPSGQPYAIIEL